MADERKTNILVLFVLGRARKDALLSDPEFVAVLVTHVVQVFVTGKRKCETKCEIKLKIGAACKQYAFHFLTHVRSC
jgi:hypothetical protein